MKFKVKVITSNKEKIEIEVDAEDRKSAISNLRTQGFLILEMAEKPSISKRSLSGTEYDNSWTSEEIAWADERQREIERGNRTQKNIAQSKKAKIPKPDNNFMDSSKSEPQFNPKKEGNPITDIGRWIFFIVVIAIPVIGNYKNTPHSETIEPTTSKLSQSCTMNGFGQGSCSFTNTGKSITAICGVIKVESLTRNEYSSIFCSGEVHPSSTTKTEFSIPGVRDICPKGLTDSYCDFYFIEQ